jgi:DNA-binding MarR family transcriptional regulator
MVLKDLDPSKSLCETNEVGLAEEAFDRLRRIAFEGEHVEKMAALGARTKLSPGVIKTLVRLERSDGISMGEMARGIGCDPSYITALVDDLAARGLATREPDPVDRRVKTVVLTAKGRSLAREIHAVLSVPPAAFDVLSRTELRQLRALLDKVVAADPALSGEVPERVASAR